VNQKNLSGRQARWIEKISSFDFDIEYVPGTDNVLADALSPIYSNEAPGTVRARSEYTYHDVIDMDVLDLGAISMPVFAGGEAAALAGDRVTRSMTRELRKAQSPSASVSAAEGGNSPRYALRPRFKAQEGGGTHQNPKENSPKASKYPKAKDNTKPEASTTAVGADHKSDPRLTPVKATDVSDPQLTSVKTTDVSDPQLISVKATDVSDRTRDPSMTHSRKSSPTLRSAHHDSHGTRSGSVNETTESGTELDTMDKSLLEVVNSGWRGLDIVSLVAYQYSDDSFFKLILQTPKAFCNFDVENGLIYLQQEDACLLCIPAISYRSRNLREIIISEAHSILAHLGARKTLDYLRDHVWWKEMVEDVRVFCETCGTCKHSKSSTQKPYGLLHSLNPPSQPWEVIGIDFVGPLPESRTGTEFLIPSLLLLTC
jgi:hypothetical protein